MHSAMCKTKNGVPSVKSVPVMAGGGAAVGTEPCREDSQAVPPQEKDRCQWEQDGVPAPLFFGQTDLKEKQKSLHFSLWRKPRKMENPQMDSLPSVHFRV